jgi:protein-disulfide isomerase
MDLHSIAGAQRSATLMFAIAAITLASAGCANDGGAAEKPKTAPPVTEGGLPAVLATVGTDSITLADVRGRLGDQLDQLDMAYRRSRDKMVQTVLDSLVHERLIAAEMKKTGKTADQLFADAIGGDSAVSEIEIAAWYSDNQARVGGRSLDQVRPQISALLLKERKTQAATKLDKRLMDENRVKIAFEPFRLTFANEGAPTLGKNESPVTLVEFSDFQCPYCRASAPTLKQVAQKFGDKVQIIYRQYPIPSLHPFAFKAAEASLCANDQGKFWEMHDAMFADQKKLTVSDLKATARTIGMDGKKFDACLDAGRHVEQVQNDQREGERIGVTGTPAMYINGKYVEGGSVPFSTLEALIEKELLRINAKS